jgi:hypothetical protein
MSQEFGIDSLNDDILVYEVLWRLEPSNIASLARINKRFNRLCKDQRIYVINPSLRPYYIGAVLHKDNSSRFSHFLLPIR